uniref:Uncharacterized protein n=1 Tax=Vitis vinifera TaxID=29760 RepID=F6HBS1_VITVI
MNITKNCKFLGYKHKKLTLTNKINIKKLTLSCNIKFRKQNLMQLKRNKKIR